MKLEFSRQVFEKYADIKCHENPSNGSGVVPCGRKETDRHDEANSSFAQFCQSAQELPHLKRNTSLCRNRQKVLIRTLHY